MTQYFSFLLLNIMSPFADNLPGIRKIAFIPCKNLVSDIVPKNLAGIPVGIFAEPVAVAFFGNPVYEISSESVPNASLFKHSLKFVSSDHIPLSENLAFIITDIAGTSFILGAKERPFPLIKVSLSKGIPSSQSAASAYEISWTALSKLIPCNL